MNTLLIIPENDKPKVIICSVEEAEQFAGEFSKRAVPAQRMWLVHPNGELAWPSPYEYNRDKIFDDNPHVERLILQTLYYAGNVKALKEDRWLKVLKKWLEGMSLSERKTVKTFFEEEILRKNLPNEYLYSHLYTIW